jgi:uncharacterized repeat protein (TIGR03803 family)
MGLALEAWAVASFLQLGLEVKIKVEGVLRNFRHFHVLLLASLVSAILFVTSANASNGETVIYSFRGGTDEGFPQGGLAMDSSGNLYGTTLGGGLSDYYGTVFRLQPVSIGVWKQTVLHLFTGATDGSQPYAPVIFDSKGNLYGTTSSGGDLFGCNGLGCGLVFKLTPTPHGQWKETVLYRFTGGADGSQPHASLTLDAGGNIYGTTTRGGDTSCDCGIVFQLAPNGNAWGETVVHAFTGTDGEYPDAGLTFDATGNLYGTASEGGLFGGVVFELSPNSGGSWQERNLYEFSDGADGGFPVAGVIFDSKGNLFGTGSEGGGADAGIVFELSPDSKGDWTENVLYDFPGNGGRYPKGELIIDLAGNLYGTASYGGTADGSVFELSPSAGSWTETEIYDFTGGQDGGQPESGLIMDKTGTLFGTASVGGALGWGAIFRLHPH